MVIRFDDILAELKGDSGLFAECLKEAAKPPHASTNAPSFKAANDASLMKPIELELEIAPISVTIPCSFSKHTAKRKFQDALITLESQYYTLNLPSGLEICRNPWTRRTWKFYNEHVSQKWDIEDTCFYLFEEFVVFIPKPVKIQKPKFLKTQKNNYLPCSVTNFHKNAF
jgi:hypothetical protein